MGNERKDDWVNFLSPIFRAELGANRAGEVWFLYRLQPAHYDHLSQEARVGLLWRYSRLCWTLEDCHGQLMIIPRERSLRAHLAALQERAGGPHGAMAEAALSQATQLLQERHNGMELDYVLGLRLPNRGDPFALDARNILQSFWQEPRRALEQLLRLRGRSLTDAELAGWLEREELLFQRLNRVVKATRLDEPQIAWLIRRGFWRGTAGEPNLRLHSHPDCLVAEGADGRRHLSPDRAEMARLAEGEMGLVSAAFSSRRAIQASESHSHRQAAAAAIPVSRFRLRDTPGPLEAPEADAAGVGQSADLHQEFYLLRVRLGVGGDVVPGRGEGTPLRGSGSRTVPRGSAMQHFLGICGWSSGQDRGGVRRTPFRKR